MARFVQYADLDFAELLERLAEGAIILYPTDTVYSIGCDATNERAVRLIKSLPGISRPLGLVAPSKVWLKKHFVLPASFLAKLPGPFTFVVLPRGGAVVSAQLSSRGTYRVRLPDHKFVKSLAKSQLALVDTTLVGRGLADPTQLPPEILAMVDIVVVDGVCRKPLSSVLDVTNGMPLLVTR